MAASEAFRLTAGAASSPYADDVGRSVSGDLWPTWRKDLDDRGLPGVTPNPQIEEAADGEQDRADEGEIDAD